MPIIVVPDDEPPALAGTIEEKRLRQLGEVRIYDSKALGDIAMSLLTSTSI